MKIGNSLDVCFRLWMVSINGVYLFNFQYSRIHHHLPQQSTIQYTKMSSTKQELLPIMEKEEGDGGNTPQEIPETGDKVTPSHARYSCDEYLRAIRTARPDKRPKSEHSQRSNSAGMFRPFSSYLLCLSPARHDLRGTPHLSGA